MNEDVVRLFTDRLEALGLRYAVTGSVAAIAYGEPRMTNDIDLVLELPEGRIAELVASFPEDQFYCAPPEVIAVEGRRAARGHFNIIHHKTGFKADVYLAGTDPLQRWAVEQARPLDLGEGRLRLAPPEYVILFKLLFHREGGSEKHLFDIRAILRQAPPLDLELLQERVRELGLEREWALAQGEPAG